MACVCAVKPDFKDTAALKGYDFIALVKIVKVAPTNTKHPYIGMRLNGNMKIEVEELFKGQSSTIAFDPNFDNDCALYVMPGEQWLLFGSIYKGKLNVSYCGYSVKYRNNTGVRRWGDFAGIKQLALLRQLYGHPVNSNIIAKVLYPNGSIEIEQSFKNNKLDGYRTIYYPDGKINVKEQFKDGQRVGERDVYDASGQLTYHEVYKGNFILQKVLYHDTTYKSREIRYLAQHPETSYWGKKQYAPMETLMKIDSVQILKSLALPYYIYNYQPDGRSYTYQYFYLDGKIKSETKLDWDKKWAENREYDTGGDLHSQRIIDQKNDKEIVGNPEDKFNQRTFKCSSCQYYFIADAPPEGTPEPVYVQ